MRNIVLIRSEISRILKSRDNRRFDNQQDADKASTEILEMLEKLCPNDIKIEYDRNPLDITVNCYAYALGFRDSLKYMNELAHVFYPSENLSSGISCGAQSNFIFFLLEKGYLQEIKIPINGCLVLYFKAQKPVHIGILKRKEDEENKNIVCSRWGNFKAIFEHGLWYVGEEYGTEIKYYHALDMQESENYFREFLNSQLNTA